MGIAARDAVGGGRSPRQTGRDRSCRSPHAPQRRRAVSARRDVQPFGAGKCFIELVDSTWVWRWRVGDRYFYRYWGQVFRALTPKEIPGNSRFVQLNADRSNYRLGEKVSAFPPAC